MTEDTSKQLARATGHSRPLNPNHCRHFNGVFPLTKTRTCEAGVKYMKMNPKPVHSGWMGQLPCLKKNETNLKCKKRSFPTDEELQAANELTAEGWDNVISGVLNTVPLIRADADSKSARSGTVICPLCEGPLHYTINGRKNHVHAACTTKGCLSFME